MNIVGKLPRRGDTIKISFKLDGDVQQGDFDRLDFTARRSIPDSGVLNDADALGQVTPQFVGQDGLATFPASMTNGWPIGEIYWDLQGVTDVEVYTLADGKFKLLGDVTRRQS